MKTGNNGSGLFGVALSCALFFFAEVEWVYGHGYLSRKYTQQRRAEFAGCDCKSVSSTLVRTYTKDHFNSPVTMHGVKVDQFHWHDWVDTGTLCVRPWWNHYDLRCDRHKNVCKDVDVFWGECGKDDTDCQSRIESPFLPSNWEKRFVSSKNVYQYWSTERRCERVRT